MTASNLPLRGVQGKGVLSVGCFGWYPNEEGMIWFIKEVLPRLRKKVLSPEITVAGNEIGRLWSGKLKRAGFGFILTYQNILPFSRWIPYLDIPPVK